MGELLLETKLLTERSHGLKETNGGNAKFPQHAFCNARYARGTSRCTTWHATYGRTRRYAARNATDDGADDGSGRGPYADGRWDFHADDAGGSGRSRRGRSESELWWTRIWSTRSESADGVRIWWWRWWRRWWWGEKSRRPWKPKMVAFTNNFPIQIGHCSSFSCL